MLPERRRLFDVCKTLRARCSTIGRVRRVRVLVPVALLALPVGTIAAGRADSHTLLRTATATMFSGTATVGPLFRSASSTQHFCTASVISSPQGDVLLTAAHCVEGSGAGYVFAPGFHNGISPYGRWTVTAAYLDPAWLANENPERDFAFLTVAPKWIDGRRLEIQQVTSANQLGLRAIAGQDVTIPAYPGGGDNNPVICTVPLHYDGPYPSFECNPYVGGTSGAPWLVHTRNGSVVVGLVGGLHQGGCYSFISYSPVLGHAAQQTYERAAAGDRGDRAPPPGGDGC